MAEHVGEYDLVSLSNLAQSVGTTIYFDSSVKLLLDCLHAKLVEENVDSPLFFQGFLKYMEACVNLHCPIPDLEELL